LKIENLQLAILATNLQPATPH